MKKLLTFVLLCSAFSHAAVTIVQSKHGVVSNGNGSVAFTAPTVAGHSVIAVVAIPYFVVDGSATMSDDASVSNIYRNTHARVLANNFNAGQTVGSEALITIAADADTASTAVKSMQTVTFANWNPPGNAYNLSVWLYEVSGLNAYSVALLPSVFAHIGSIQNLGGSGTGSIPTASPIAQETFSNFALGTANLYFAVVAPTSPGISAVGAPWTLDTVQNGFAVAYLIDSTGIDHIATFTNGSSSTYSSSYAVLPSSSSAATGGCPGIPPTTALSACLSGVALAGGNAGWQVPGVPRLTITKATLANGALGSPYSDTLSAVNGVPPYTWSIAFGTLPPGLSLNSVTGAITGTPTASGTFNFTALVFDSSTPTAQTATKDISISITCPTLTDISASPLPPATTGVNYNFRFQPQGGLLPLSWACINLPPGLACDASGLLNGIPTSSGAFTLTATVTDSCAPVAQSVPKSFDIAINSPVVINTLSPLPNETVGVPVSIPFAANGGTGPYLWTFTGTLPAGLNLASDGTFAGTPTTAGTSTFTVKATDSGGLFTTKVFTVTVGCPPISVTSNATLQPATQNAQYRFQFLSNGGVAPVAWSFTGTLPPGLTLSSGGSLAGIPTSPGTFHFTVNVTDSCVTPQTATQDVTLVVSNALIIVTSNPLPTLVVGQPASIPLQAQNGVLPYTWSVPSGPVPAGAIDMLDWELMPLPDRNSFHLTGGLAPRYARLDGGLIWQMKAASGHPWDGNWYDDQYVYLGFTDNNDSSQQAACIAAGFTSCFVDPFAYKMALTLRRFTPRYFVPGSTVTILTPPVLTGGGQVNPRIRTTNCGVDNQGISYLGNIKTVTSGPANPPSWLVGNDITATSPTITTLYYYSGDITGTYQNIERFYFVKGLGWAGWEHALWNSTTLSYDPPDMQSADNNKVAGGLTSAPNFGCGVPSLPITGKLPDGTSQTSAPSLNLVDSTGVITGTPTQSGTSTMHVQVEDAVGTIAQKDLTLTVVCPAFAIATTSLPSGSQASPYNFTIQTTNGISPVSFTESGTLPAGMTLSNTGVLSGTPSNFGSFLFTVTATDSCLPQPTAKQTTFSLTINPNSGPLAFTTTSPLQGAFQSQTYSQQINVTGGTQPYTYLVTVGTLPAGLTMVNGKIAGIPTATGTSTFTVRVTDAIGTQITRVFSLTAACQPITLVSPLSLPNGVQNQNYNPYQLVASGGVLPYSWTRTGGAFAAGMTFPTTGVLSGTPTTSGSFSPIIQVADACSPTPQVISNTFSLSIAAAVVPLVISTPPTLQAGVVNAVYASSVAATGGTQPYFWALTSAPSTLPPGLTVNPDGTITGTPTIAGTYAPTIQVTDSLGATASQTFSITIACPALTIFGGATATLPNGTVGAAFQFQFTSSGGISPFNWTTISGALPPGLILSSAGKLSGTPTTAGMFSFTVQVTDSCSTPQNPTQVVTITINPAAVPLQISTASLPSGTIGQPYAITLSAIGGTPPYTNWIISSGALPAGLILDTLTGFLHGTPTLAQVTTPTIQVQDAVPNIASKAFSITINVTSTADNRYCGPNEIPVGLAADGPAQPLQKCVYTPLAGTPSPGSIITVTAGSFSDLQTKATAIACGQTLVIPARSGNAQAVYSGHLVLPVKTCAAGQWITMRTDQVASLPPEGTRISPAWVNIPTLVGRPTYNQPSVAGIYLPKLQNNQTNQSTVNCGVGSSRWRFIGLEVTSSAGVSVQNSMIACTSTDHMIFDRMLVHGGDTTAWQNKNINSQGIGFGTSTYGAVIDSYIADIHCPTNTCIDSYAIEPGGSGGSVTGPLKTVNNFEEASGESCGLSGGGGQGASSTTFPVTDWEMRRNHCFKPLFWKSNDPSYFGTSFIVKNSFELKNTNRILIEGNIFDTTWGGQSDQFGTLVNLGAKNQSAFTSGNASSNGTGTLTALAGATFSSTVVSPLCGTPLHCVVRYNGINYTTQTFVDTTHITVTPAPPSSASAFFLAFIPGLNPQAIVANVTMRYNHLIHGSRALAIFAVKSDGGDYALGDNNISVHDNVADDIDTKWNVALGSCCFWASSFQIQNQFPSPNNLHDISLFHNTALSFQTFGTYSNGNGGPSFGFGFQSDPNGVVKNLKIFDNIGTVGWTGSASICNTGQDTVLNRMKCYDTLAGVPQNTYCFDHNLFATTTQAPITGATNNPPYPTAADSPGCGFPRTGQTFVANFAAIGFTSLNAGNGGNYLLLNTSPGHNAAHDGTDLGANINLLNQYTNGVQ